MKLKTNKTLTKGLRKNEYNKWQIVIEEINWKQTIFFIKWLRTKITNKKIRAEIKKPKIKRTNMEFFREERGKKRNDHQR
jgi:hypothetical protein